MWRGGHWRSGPETQILALSMAHRGYQRLRGPQRLTCHGRCWPQRRRGAAGADCAPAPSTKSLVPKSLCPLGCVALPISQKLADLGTPNFPSTHPLTTTFRSGAKVFCARWTVGPYELPKTARSWNPKPPSTHPPTTTFWASAKGALQGTRPKDSSAQLWSERPRRSTRCVDRREQNVRL